MNRVNGSARGMGVRVLVAGFVAGAVLAGATRGGAQLAHVWVSPPYGSASGTGTATSPVQTLAQAHALVAEGGQINVRDSGEVGALAITKSLTIDGNGAQAVVSNGTGSGIYIVTGATNVTIRNLTFNGLGVGYIGLGFHEGSTLNVENCTFTGWLFGIDAWRESTAYLKVSNCTFKNCRSSGIATYTTPGSVFGTFENVEISNCQTGIWAGNGARLTVRNSTLNSNGMGIYFLQQGATSKAVIDNCMLTNNSTAFDVYTGCTARFLETTFVQNNVVHQNSGGVFQSNGTNTMIANPTNGPAPAPIPNI